MSDPHIFGNTEHTQTVCMYVRYFFQKILHFFGQNPEIGCERAPFRLGAQLFDRAGTQCIDTADRFAEPLTDPARWS